MQRTYYTKFMDFHTISWYLEKIQIYPVYLITSFLL